MTRMDWNKAKQSDRQHKPEEFNVGRESKVIKDGRAIERFKRLIPRLNPSDQRFAWSLVSSFSRSWRLSKKQWLWVAKLAQRANDEAIEQAEIRLEAERRI